MLLHERKSLAWNATTRPWPPTSSFKEREVHPYAFGNERAPAATGTAGAHFWDATIPGGDVGPRLASPP